MAIYRLGFPELISDVAKKAPGQQGESGGKRFKSDVIFEEIRERAAQVGGIDQRTKWASEMNAFVQEAEMAKQIGAAYKFVISQGADKQEWTVDLKSQPPFVGKGAREGHQKPEVEIALTDETFVQMAAGKLKPDQVRGRRRW